MTTPALDRTDTRFASDDVQATQLAQNTQAQRPSSSGAPSLQDVLSTAAPDALVYSNDRLNNASTRNFTLVNPLSGNYSHFITHKNDNVTVAGVPLKRVETIHYNTNGTGTRREDGLGWSAQANGVTVFANIRAGDSNLVNSANGASANVGFFGSPKALEGLVQRLEGSGDARVRNVARVLDSGLQAASASGSQFGLAWRGTLQYNSNSKQVELNISGARIPLADFSRALETLPKTNAGFAEVARANNREDYLGGANPYNLADYTRDPADKGYRNHGDPVSAIAGGIDRLGQVVNPGAPPVRSNADAKQVLEEAIDRNFTPLTPEQRRMYGEDAATLRPDPLNAEQRNLVNSTLAQMHAYGLDFGSEKIRTASADAARFVGTAEQPPGDRQFVRDVFEGDFRYNFNDSYDIGDLGRDVVIGINRWAGVATSIFDAQPVARDDQYLQRNQALQDGFAARLNTQSGGVLKALGLDDNGLSGTQRTQYEGKVTSALSSVLAGRLNERDIATTSQSLYDEFTRLPPAERQAIAARINAAVR